MSTIRVDELRALSDNDFKINLEGNDNLIIAGNIEMDSGASFSVPVGTTAQRPSAPIGGMLRYNTDLGELEFYDGSGWETFIGVGGGTAGGTTEGSAVSSVQALYDAGHQQDGFYWLDFDGTPRQYFVPLESHPFYILLGNWGGGASRFFGTQASALSGRELNLQGDLTPEGNFANNGTYGYYRNAGGSDFRYATMNRRGISYRYVKCKFNLYNYYSNDGINGRNFLGINSGVGDGLTIMRDNSGDGDGQHIFTYITALSNQDGNSCPSTAGRYPSHRRQGNNPGGFMGDRFTCFSREGNSYTSEYVRNFTPFPGDSSGGTKPNVYNGDAWYTIDLGQNYPHNMHCVIHSDQDSGNEDTYLKRGVVLVRPA
ncbi:hypothetical protein SBM1_00167 [Synechococcus phage S-BM1]|nr:hypothetical protein SBM1_00167 [Synechococcus phage S-BM1]